jgi:preprotein translocase subunit SecE
MKKFWQFLKDSRIELTKVAWPTRRQAFEMTVAVLVIVLVVSIYLGAVDYLLSKGIALLLKK